MSAQLGSAEAVDDLSEADEALSQRIGQGCQLGPGHVHADGNVEPDRYFSLDRDPLTDGKVQVEVDRDRQLHGHGDVHGDVDAEGCRRW